MGLVNWRLTLLLECESSLVDRRLVSRNTGVTMVRAWKKNRAMSEHTLNMPSALRMNEYLSFARWCVAMGVEVLLVLLYAAETVWVGIKYLKSSDIFSDRESSRIDRIVAMIVTNVRGVEVEWMDQRGGAPRLLAGGLRVTVNEIGVEESRVCSSQRVGEAN